MMDEVGADVGRDRAAGEARAERRRAPASSRQRMSRSRCSWVIVGPRSAGSTRPRTVWTRPTRPTAAGHRHGASGSRPGVLPHDTLDRRLDLEVELRAQHEDVRPERTQLPRVAGRDLALDGRRDGRRADERLDPLADVGGQGVRRAFLRVVLRIDAEHQAHDVGARSPRGPATAAATSAGDLGRAGPCS